MSNKWMKQVDLIYDSLMTGFADNICNIHNNNEAFQAFTEKLNISRQFAYKHPEFAILQALLNNIAQSWDLEIERNRQIRNPSHMLKPYHRFLMVPIHQRMSPYPIIQAVMFLKEELPDSRTVVINLSSLNRDSLRCLMHEMGHFVGFRDRKNRLIEVFIPILADSICRNVYECACSYATFDELNSSSWAMVSYSEDESYSKRTNTFAYHLINGLREIHPVLVSGISGEYQEVLRVYTDPNENHEIADRELRSIHSGFFCSIDYIMLTAICNLLHSAEFEEKVRNIVSEYSVRNCPEAESELLERMLEGFSFIKSTLFRYNEKPLWYTECENILEEPAADMFMIKMSNMNARQYVDLMTKQIQNAPSVSSFADMQSILSQRAVHVRVVGVAHSMGMKPSVVRRLLYQVLEHILPRSTRLYQRIRVKEQLNCMLEKANELIMSPMDSDFFDPTRYVFKYIKGLWEDRRYSDFMCRHGGGMHLLEYVWRLRRIPGARVIAKIWLHLHNEDCSA